jgi:Xaa-Pro aminopeptidase
MKPEATYNLVPTKEDNIKKYIKENDIHDNPVDLLLFESIELLRQVIDFVDRKGTDLNQFRFRIDNFNDLLDNIRASINQLNEDDCNDQIYNFLKKTSCIDNVKIYLIERNANLYELQQEVQTTVNKYSPYIDTLIEEMRECKHDDEFKRHKQLKEIADELFFRKFDKSKPDVEKFLMEARNYTVFRFKPYPDTNLYALHSNAPEYIKFVKENNTSDEELMYMYNYICKSF